MAYTIQDIWHFYLAVVSAFLPRCIVLIGVPYFRDIVHYWDIVADAV